MNSLFLFAMVLGLLFIGVPVGVSLGVVVGILAVTMLLSVRTANVPAKGQKA